MMGSQAHVLVVLIGVLLWFAVPLLLRLRFRNARRAVSDEEFVASEEVFASLPFDTVVARRERLSEVVRMPKERLAADEYIGTVLHTLDLVDQDSARGMLIGILVEEGAAETVAEAVVSRGTVGEWCMTPRVRSDRENWQQAE